MSIFDAAQTLKNIKERVQLALPPNATCTLELRLNYIERAPLFFYFYIPDLLPHLQLPDTAIHSEEELTAFITDLDQWANRLPPYATLVQQSAALNLSRALDKADDAGIDTEGMRLAFRESCEFLLLEE